MKINNKFKSALIIIIWGIVFIILTPIILCVSRRGLKSPNTDLSITDTQIYYAIDDFIYYDNFLQDIHVSGWAFIETNQANEDKTVKLIFESKNNSYEVEMVLSSRGELIHAFTDKNVPEFRTGISTTFSHLGMKNGLYTMYLYVYENEEQFGLVNTYRKYRKDYRSFIKYNGGELVSMEYFSNIQVSESVTTSIDIVEVLGEKFIVRGWAFLENTESAQHQVYVEITKPDGTISYYTTIKVLRADVGNYFGDERYNLSGFSAEIPIDALGIGENVIAVVINEQYQSSSIAIFDWKGYER